MKILALDIATQTGWCNNDGFGTWKMKPKTRIVEFYNHLDMMFINNRPNLVVYEFPAGRFTTPIMTESELIGILKYLCAINDIEFQGYAATAIKKHVTGKGNAKKQQVMDAVIAKYNVTPKNYDEADAIALWNMAMRETL